MHKVAKDLILEFAAPVFTSGLTKEQAKKIELVQKKAFEIILGSQYDNYEASLDALQQVRLDMRREDLCLKFARKCAKSAKHCHMFPPNPNHHPASRHKKPYKEQKCNTSRYFNSPIPFLTRLLNKKASE